MKKFNPLLEKADSFFQVNTKKIIGRASYLLGNQIFGNILSLIITITAANLISKDTYGTYRYILSTIGFVAAFSLTGLATAIVRSTARGYDNLFTTSIKRSILWSLPAIIIGVSIGVWYLWNGNITLGYSMLIGGVSFPLIQTFLLFRSYLNGKEYFKLLMQTNIVYSAITSLSLLFVLFLNPSVLTLICTYYASNLIATFLITIYVRKKFKPNKNIDPESGKLEHHISLMNILDIGATQLDKIILFQISGPIEVSRYVFATIIPEQLRNIIKYVSTLSMPVFSSLPKNISKSKGLFLASRLFLVTVPIVIFYFFIAPLIYKIFFPQYIEVVSYSQLFALILLFDGGITGTVLKAKNEVKKLYFVNIFSNITKVILLVILGLTMGIWGVIISRIISRIISYITSYILLSKMKADEI